jgi:hypothetical protein
VAWSPCADIKHYDGRQVNPAAAFETKKASTKRTLYQAVC